MPPADSRLALAEAMGEDLEAYLLSSAPSWPVMPLPGGGAYPSHVSLGALQLLLDELEVRRSSFPHGEESHWMGLTKKLEEVRARHPALCQRKAQAEQESRLRLWRSYLEDVAEGAGSIQDYPGEVRHRLAAARLSLWAASPAQSAAMTEAAATHDGLLRGRFRPGGFVLEDSLRSLYPSEEYWYLYGGVRGI